MSALLPPDRQLLAHILNEAHVLLWTARVRRVGEDFHWQFSLLPESAHSPLLDYTRYHQTGHLWEPDNSPDFYATQKTYQAALARGANRYQQQFRLVRGAETLWLEELAGIEATGPDEWLFTGIIRDVTKSKLTEESERRATVELHRVLNHAECLLWHATVTDLGDPTFHWELVFPMSAMKRRIFDEMKSDVTNEIYAPFDVPQLPEMIERAQTAMRRGAKGYEQEFAITRRRDGQTFWIREQVVIAPAGPKRWELSGVMIDITARRLAERAQRDSEMQLRHFVDRADCLLWQARLDHRADGDYDWFITAHPSMMFRRLFKREPETPVLLWTRENAPDFDRMNDRWRRALVANEPNYEQEFRYLADGQLFWLHEQASVMKRDGGTVFLAGVIIDITARKLAELQLTTEKERLAVTLRAMDEAVATVGLDGEVTFLNRAAELLLGIEAGAALGRRFPELARLEIGHPSRTAPWPIDVALHEGHSAFLPPDSQLARPSGPPVRIEGCVAPLRDAQSGRQGAVLVLRDVTERHVLQSHMQRASNLESVGLLAGGIAHDFNNILTAISLNLSLAQLEVAAGSELADHLKQARSATDRAGELARQLLTFAKGGDPLLSAVNLTEVIEEVARFTLRGSRVDYTLALAPDLWPARADRGQFAQIVQNLVLNAAQAMPDGGSVRIAAHNVCLGFNAGGTLAPGDYVHLTISDTGAGIAPEALAQIFTPYFTTKKEGHGLGLAVVYSIVKKHHGSIEAHSALGVGTTFDLRLPAARDQATERSAPPPVTGAMHGRVLIMDDEEPILRVLLTFLRRLGLEVETVGDGAEAVACYRAAFERGQPHDLLIMDLTVPGKMGGREAIAAILAFDPQARAIVASGYSGDPVLARYWEYGFRAVAPKPYDIEQLSRLIAQLLAERPGPPGTPPAAPR